MVHLLKNLGRNDPWGQIWPQESPVREGLDRPSLAYESYGMMVNV